MGKPENIYAPEGRFVICELSEGQVDALANSIKKSSFDIKKEIASAYSRDIKNPNTIKNNLAELIWKARLEFRKPKASDEDYKGYLKRTKKIKNLSKELLDIIELRANFEIAMLEHSSYQKKYEFISDDGEDKYEGTIDIGTDEMCEFLVKMHVMAINAENELMGAIQTKGRPSLGAYYNFVYQNACLFEKITCNTFSVLRHQIGGEYAPITDGHMFITEATAILNSRTSACYTSKNILNACEKAVKQKNSTPI